MKVLVNFYVITLLIFYSGNAMQPDAPQPKNIISLKDMCLKIVLTKKMNFTQAKHINSCIPKNHNKSIIPSLSALSLSKCATTLQKHNYDLDEISKTCLKSPSHITFLAIWDNANHKERHEHQIPLITPCEALWHDNINFKTAFLKHIISENTIAYLVNCIRQKNKSVRQIFIDLEENKKLSESCRQNMIAIWIIAQHRSNLMQCIIHQPEIIDAVEKHKDYLAKEKNYNNFMNYCASEICRRKNINRPAPMNYNDLPDRDKSKLLQRAKQMHDLFALYTFYEIASKLINNAIDSLTQSSTSEESYELYNTIKDLCLYYENKS